MRHNVYRNGRLHVCAEMCPTCVFRPGNRMHLRPARLRGMIEDAKANQSCIVCHSTLDGGNACCRGFFDRYPTQPLQIAERLGLVEYVDVPNKGMLNLET